MLLRIFLHLITHFYLTRNSPKKEKNEEASKYLDNVQQTILSLTEKVKELEKINDVALRKEIDEFRNDPQFGLFYQKFYTFFTNRMTNELLGIKSSLNQFAKETTAHKAVEAFSSPKALIPGLSTVISILFWIPEKVVNDAEKVPLQKLSTFVSGLDEINLFIRQTTLCHLKLFEEQIKMLDTYKDGDIQVDEDAMKKFVNSLITRLFAFMLSKDFHQIPDEEKPLKLTLSLTHFNPGLYFKINREQMIPGIDTTITERPTLKNLTLSQQAASKRAAIRKVATGLAQRKNYTSAIHGQKKFLSDKGLLQRAPWKTDDTYYAPANCRSIDYPPLIAKVLPSPNEFPSLDLSRLNSAPERKKLSYRELIAHWNKIKHWYHPMTQEKAKELRLVKDELNRVGYKISVNHPQIEKRKVEDKQPAVDQPSPILPPYKEVFAMTHEELVREVIEQKKEIGTLQETLKDVLNRLEKN